MASTDRKPENPDREDARLRDALLEANRRDFEDVLKSGEEILFSDQYEKRMRRITDNFAEYRKAGERKKADPAIKISSDGLLQRRNGLPRRHRNISRTALCILLAAVLFGGGVLIVSPKARAAVADWLRQWHFFSADEYVSVSETDTFHVLSSPARVESEDGYLEAESACMKNGVLRLALRGSIPVEELPEKYISVSDPEGNSGKYLSCDYMYEEADGCFSALILMEFQKSGREYTLNCVSADSGNPVKLPLRFTEAKEGDLLTVSGWYSDPANGISLYAFAE